MSSQNLGGRQFGNTVYIHVYCKGAWGKGWGHLLSLVFLKSPAALQPFLSFVLEQLWREGEEKKKPPQMKKLFKPFVSEFDCFLWVFSFLHLKF